MKRPFLLLIIITAAIGLFLIYAANATRTESRQVSIPFAYDKTVLQIVRLHNLKKWLMPFSSAAMQAGTLEHGTDSLSNGEYSAVLAVQNPLASMVRLKKGNKEQTVYFNVLPDSGNIRSCTVLMHYDYTLLQGLIGNELQQNCLKSLEHFDRFMSDPAEYYGYPITKAKVTDTAFLFTKIETDSAGKSRETNDMYERLIACANKMQAGYNGVRIFHAQKLPGNRLSLSAGIGISKRLQLDSSNAIKFKGMPPGYNLLTVDFNGFYRDVPKVYAAMEAYIADRGITVMAIPFEKILSNGFSFADTDHVRVRVTFPTFQ